MHITKQASKDKSDKSKVKDTPNKTPADSKSADAKTDPQPNAGEALPAADSALPLDPNDPEAKLKRFEGQGVVVKAKLIGSELVIEPRGDKMCQNSIQRLKAIIKGTNSHKKRIVLKISYDGVKVFDEKTNEILHHHKVPEISYIASDETDSRSFGYVCDVPSNAHQFICFKTIGPAVAVMSIISALFDAVLEKNKAINETSVTKEAKLADADVKLIGDDDDDPDADSSFVNSSANAAALALSIGSFAAVDPAEELKTFTPGRLPTPVSTKKPSTPSDLAFGLSEPIIVDSKSGGSLISDKNYIMSGAPSIPPPPGRQASVVTSATAHRANQLATGQSQRYQSQDSLDFLNESGNSSLSAFQLSYLYKSSPPAMQMASAIQQGFANPQPSQCGIAVPLSTVRQRPGSNFNVPASSLPRPSSLAHHNRSLIYNHSSASLGDVGRSSSVASSGIGGDSGVDRYAVFNDIDTLPSIFESATLGDKKQEQQQQLQQHQFRPQGQQQQSNLYQQQQYNQISPRAPPQHPFYQQQQQSQQQIPPQTYFGKPMPYNSSSSQGTSFNDSFMSSHSLLNSSLGAPGFGQIQQHAQQQPQHPQQQQQQQFKPQFASSVGNNNNNNNTIADKGLAKDGSQTDVFACLNPFEDEFFS